MMRDGKRYLVSQYEAVWSLSRRNYKRLCRLLEKDEPYDLDELGRRVGDIDLHPLHWENEGEIE